MVEWLKGLASWHDLFVGVLVFVESNFITALVGSLAGAFGGAWAAQRIAERTKLREELLREIRNTNAASSMLYGIANSHLGLKSQHVQALRDKYLEETSKLRLFMQARQAGTVPPRQVFQFNADLQTLKPIFSPIEQIQKMMFDHISITGAALFALPVLVGSIQSLNECLLDRNRLVEEWKARQPERFPEVYFGLEQDSVVDQRYKMLVDAIYRQTDDVIAFSTIIGDALYDHAIELRRRLRERFRADGPAITKLDFSRFKEFLPPSEEYKDFHAMFSNDKATRKAS